MKRKIKSEHVKYLFRLAHARFLHYSARLKRKTRCHKSNN